MWFTKSGSTPRRLGFAKTQVGKDGVLTTAGPQKADEDAFPSLVRDLREGPDHARDDQVEQARARCARGVAPRRRRLTPRC